jgi:hypothetical protein
MHGHLKIKNIFIDLDKHNGDDSPQSEYWHFVSKWRLEGTQKEKELD